jgi:hypothetical protein
MPTAPRLTTAAAMRTTSLTGRDGSSRVACAAVSCAFIGPMLSQVHTRNVSAPASQPIAGEIKAASSRIVTSAALAPTRADTAIRIPLLTP